ncbi:MAG: type I pullulanase, partial [Prevotella salivae]|nr:type I pullulanase [Segatella salivae]
PAFRLGDAELVRKHLSFLPVKPCVVGFMLTNHAGGDDWNNIVVILNGSREPQDIDIPAGNYTVVACDGTINQQGLGHMQGGKISVNAQSALILHD